MKLLLAENYKMASTSVENDKQAAGGAAGGVTGEAAAAPAAAATPEAAGAPSTPGQVSDLASLLRMRVAWRLNCCAAAALLLCASQALLAGSLLPSLPRQPRAAAAIARCCVGCVPTTMLL